MDVIKKIRRTFADEHVIGVDPPMRPELPGVWRRRINPFTGRAVSDKALTAEQDVRSGLARIQGLALAPGSVEGLEILLDPDARGKKPAESFFQVAPGLGLARSGEDVSVGASRRMSFGSLQVVLRADHEDRLEGEGAPVAEAPAVGEAGEGTSGAMAERLRPNLPRRLGKSLTEIAANPESAAIPHVGVIVAQPVTATILGRPVDDCPPDPRDEPYADLQRIDGCRLAFYLWPSEMSALDGGPDYALPAADSALRNRLAYAVFDNEKLLLDGEMHPWEEWGVPLAVAAFDATWKLLFVDRFAVARIGGIPHARSQIVPMTGDPRLWQARIDQFVGQLADMPSLDQESLLQTFVRMPPVGLLPPEAYDPVQRRQHFFPGSFGVSAVPVPMSNLDLAIREAAPLASFNRSVPDRVEMLVPVPDRSYEPHLLETELEDPRFAEAVAAFRADRAEWLTRREAGRRRYDRLMESVSGRVLSWRGSDLPFEENSPAPHVQVPVEVSRTRRFNEAAALRTHSMTAAHATLPVAKSDTLFVWLKIHNGSKLTGLSLRVAAGTSSKTDVFPWRGVFWGAPDVLPIGAELVNLAARKVGELPEAGIWHRLEVPVARSWTESGIGLDGLAINAVEFAQRGGEVEWGSFGKIDASGNVYTYIGDDGPAGGILKVSGQPQTGWPWQAVAGREDLDVPDFGTVEVAGVRRVAAVDAFRAQWTQSFLDDEMAAIDETGLAPFLADVQARLKATNDAIDLGFVRARSDIYRVRQIMLGADAASRLVTSPALADLASRDEGARATSRGISDFLTESVKRGTDAIVKIAPPMPAASAAAVAAAARSTTPAAAVSGSGLSAGGAFSPTLMTLNVASAAPRFTVMSAAIAPSQPQNVLSLLASTPAPVAMAAPITPLFAAPAMLGSAAFQQATFQPAISLNVARFGLDAYRPRDIQAQSPVAGLVERTVSVAERLTPPPSIQALNYAIASKAAVVATLIGLMGGATGRPRGIELADLLMPGFERAGRKENEAPIIPTFAQLLADRARPAAQQEYVDSDKIPDSGSKHESDYFTAAVQAIDNSVAIMRLVEGRVALFQALNESICDLRDQILRSADEASAWLRSVDVEVEEARHDLVMAERLRAEEQARIDATNSRRAAILATQVSAVAWRRVREADHRKLAPALEIASGLAVNPIVACRRDHDDVPDEIHDYVELLRDAPVKWFPSVFAEVVRVDRLEAARAQIEAMRIRAMIPPYYAPPIYYSVMPRYQQSVQNALAVQRRLVEERRALIAQMNLAALNTLSLAQAHIQLRETAALGDFIDGRHRQPVLTRLANEEIDGIGQVAGCLHESFGEVAPAIRLGWAEILSEFDRPAPLQSLAGLPGWPEVPMELRRTLQGFVDWLFHRIDRNNLKATNALNELVRIAMLMAADAPVDKIIPAQLVAPAPAKVGGRFQLALDISRIRKGMTTLIRDRDDRILARAVIDDVIDGHAMATLVQNHAAITTITSDLRFHLVSGMH